ncbi:hypothetical protein BDV09DRAFT_174420 [Aspergillus tetrazonus]
MQLSRVPMDADILRCLHLDGPGLPRTPDPRLGVACDWLAAASQGQRSRGFCLVCLGRRWADPSSSSAYPRIAD